MYDVKRHMETKRHTDGLKAFTNQSTMTSLLRDKQHQSFDKQVTTAELYFTAFVAEHNLAFLAADHFTKLCKQMFPDSKIASEFSCGRTKTQAIVKSALAPTLNKKVIEACKSAPFSILCDGGNDQDARKFFAIMVRFWDENACSAITQFLAMPICNRATAEALFDAISEELGSRDIPWSNVIGYASDTASVMVGKNNSVLSRIKEKNPHVFSLGCTCHLAALCAVAGLKKLPVSIDNLLIDIYYHFKYSAKRWSEYADIEAEFEDIKPLKFLKHCTTRWLSLERCIKRLIDKWPALYAYFDREANDTDDSERVSRVDKQLKDTLTKLLCHFVLFALKPLNKFSTVLQTSTSRIGLLQSDIRVLLQEFISNFIKPEVIQNSDDLTKIKYYEQDNQVENDELGIGTSTRLLLLELEDDIAGTSIERHFFSHVRDFYETSVKKLIEKFPFEDEMIKELAFLDPQNRGLSSVRGIIDLARRFTAFTMDELDTLTAEFQDYRACSDSQLPKYDPKEDTVDYFWSALGKVKSVTDHESLRFSLLSQLAKRLMILPHSNADPERLFSMVRNIVTDHRRRLDPSTICDLLSAKVNNSKPCFDNSHLLSDDFLNSVKTATKRTLAQNAHKDH